MEGSTTFDVSVYSTEETWGSHFVPCINSNGNRKCKDAAVLMIRWREDSPAGQRSSCSVEICRECLKRVKNDELGQMLRQHRLEILLNEGFSINDSFFDDPMSCKLW